jgi:site-specific DNA recombinase
MSPTLRCAIYTRKSSEEGLEQPFNSLDAQREACEAYIKSQAHEGWRLIKTGYDDGGFSGGSMERPGLQRLMGDIQRRLIDVIVVYKVDRLTRSLADFAKIVEVLDKNSVSFVSVTQAFNTTTSMGRLTLNVLLSFAQFEREVTGERIRDKIAASRKKGLWMGGTPPLGYDVKDRKLVVNEADAEAVRTIFRIYAEKGCVSVSARELDRRGIRSKRWTSQKGVIRGGALFGRGALYMLLKNRIYIGMAVHKGTAYPGDHEAIVPKPLWDRVQTRLTDNRHRRQARVLKSGRLLAGLLFDDRGNRMSPSIVRNRHGRQYAYYVSRSRLLGKPENAGALVRVPAGEIEALVEDRVRGLLQEPARRSWDALAPGERADQLRAYIRRVVITREAASIEVSRHEHFRMAAGRAGGRIEATEDGLTIRASIQIRTRGGEQIIEANDDAAAQATRPDRALIKALARAYAWREALEQGTVSSTAELAAQAGCHVRYVRNILKLAFLAPELVEAMVAGRSLPLKLADLIASDLVLLWARQRSIFGIPADNRDSQRGPQSDG